MSKKKKKGKKESKPQLDEDLDGFNMKIDEFGEIGSTMSVDKINEFLNANVEDKKLIHREDWEEIKKSKKDEEE